MIELELHKKNLISIEIDVQTPQSMADAKRKVQQLKFFHTWVFYYFYCADHKFIKHLLKNKFTFVKTLFGKTIEQLFKKKEYQERIKFVYC